MLANMVANDVEALPQLLDVASSQQAVADNKRIFDGRYLASYRSSQSSSQPNSSWGQPPRSPFGCILAATSVVVLLLQPHWLHHHHYLQPQPGYRCGDVSVGGFGVGLQSPPVMRAKRADSLIRFAHSVGANAPICAPTVLRCPLHSYVGH